MGKSLHSQDNFLLGNSSFRFIKQLQREKLNEGFHAKCNIYNLSLHNHLGIHILDKSTGIMKFLSVFVLFAIASKASGKSIYNF